MSHYLLRRMRHGVLLLFGVSVLLFLLLESAPGNFFTEVRLNPKISAETVTALRSQYGLDRPLPVRYFRWVISSARGEFGYSFAYGMPAAALLWPRVRNTLLLAVPSLLISWLISVPLGVLASACRRRWMDRLFSGGTSLLLGMPDALLALVALLLALNTGVLPAGGMRSLDLQSNDAWPRALDLARHMVLPVGVLVLGSVPVISRHVRSSVASVMQTQFMRAAQGHGLPKHILLFRYALPAAANPLVSLFGLSIAGLLGGSLLVEVVMGWPGLGPLLLEAVFARDLFIVIGAVMLSTLLLISGNFLADVLLCAVDPRIRMRP